MPLYQDSKGTGGVAAQTRRDDRSGLLDIRKLSSVIDAQRRARPSASASSVALPSFTTPWTMQDLRPSAPAQPRPSVRKPATQADNRLLYAMISALSIAVASLGAYVVLRPPPTVVVETSAALPAIVEIDPEASEPEAEPAAVVAEPEPEPEPEAEPEAPVEPSAEAQTKRSRSSARRSRSRSRAREATETKAPPRTKKDDGVVSVECVIDPTKCSKSGRPGKAKTDEPKSTKDLPLTPNSSQVRSAMAKVKPDAKACRTRHGGSAGEKVRVKLSVVGTTGRVVSANAIEDHAGTALGRCVAKALSGATLPRFSKARTGIVYSVRM